MLPSGLLRQLIDLDESLTRAFPTRDLILEWMVGEVLTLEDTRMSRLFPLAIERQHDLLSRTELAYFERATASRFRALGCHRWISLLELTTREMKEELVWSADDIRSLVALLVDATFEIGTTHSPVPRPDTVLLPTHAHLTTGDIGTDGLDLLDRIPHDAPLRQLLPALLTHRYSHVPTAVLPIRLTTRLPVTEWEAFLDLTITDLLNINNVGRTSVSELWNRLVTLASTVEPRVKPRGEQVPDAFDARPDRSITGWSDQRIGIAPILDWAIIERGMNTLGEVVGIRLTDPPPSLIARWTHATSSSLNHPTTDAAALLLEQLVESGGSYARQILELRHSARIGRATLESVGDVVGVTRERVRQVEKKFLTQCEEHLTSENVWPLAARVEDIRRLLGVACRVGSERFELAASRARHGVDPDLRSAAENLVFHLAGPYTVEREWLFRKGSEISSHDSLTRALLPGGGVTPAEQTQLADSLGLHHDQLELLRSEGLPELSCDGRFFHRTTTLGELAIAYLEHHQREATTDELVSVLQVKSPNERSARNALFLEERIHRTRKDHWALTEWGRRRYSTIHELMLDAIDDAGGLVSLDRLTAELHESFGVSATSIRMIAERPLFVLLDGMIRRRHSGEPVDVSTSVNPTVLRHTALGAVAWRFTIDRDIVRGSGRKIPGALAAWLDIDPDSGRAVSVDERTVTLSWSAGVPAIGSLRHLVTDHGGSEGDVAVIVFHEEGWGECRILSQELIENDPIRSVALLLGAPMTAIDEDPLAAMAVELNVVARTAASMLTRCAASLRAHDDGLCLSALERVNGQAHGDHESNLA